MKNITVSLDEDLYRKSRIAAAEADTSVTALVREFLTEYTASGRTSKDAPQADEPSKKVLDIIERMRKRHPRFVSGNQLSREEVHSR